MKQVVPRTSASRITVGGLFTPAGGAKPGTDVQTQGLDDNFARSKRSNRVEEQRLKIDAADLDVQAQLEAIKKVVLESEKAGFDLQAAAGRRQGLRGRGDQARGGEGAQGGQGGRRGADDVDRPRPQGRLDDERGCWRRS